MTLKVYNDNGSITEHIISADTLTNTEIQSDISYIGLSTKEENILNIFKTYFNNSKAILFDKSNKAIIEKINKLDFNDFKKKDFSFIYFTSGTTGAPIGAFKTKENFLSEIEQLTKLFEQYTIKRIIVTVPFIHFYGSLFGAIYPLVNDIDIIIKEHFLPHDLLELVDEYSMVVTTPLYIKSLNKLQIKKDLSKSIFVSSTAPLFPEVSKEFYNNFSTDIIQIFGSTETGGIAYKYNDDEKWTPMNRVKISQNKEGELKVKSPFISNILYEDKFKVTNHEIQTFDFVEIEENQFKLVGRSSQIIKLAGKRYSTIQIENILETQPNIEKAVVFVTTDKDALRGEELNITLQTKENILIKDIKSLLKKELSNMRFTINLKLVDEIKTTLVGKKMLIQ
ncbi:MAG: AMP-binding protein [Arcobacteraceae bacterium]|nr:AMP-binding protein [Arcobacteraceae bacterium]